MNSLHGLLNCEIGGLDCYVITTENRTHVHCIHILNRKYDVCSWLSQSDYLNTGVLYVKTEFMKVYERACHEDFMHLFSTCCTRITNIFKHGRYSNRSNEYIQHGRFDLRLENSWSRVMYCKIFKADSNQLAQDTYLINHS